MPTPQDLIRAERSAVITWITAVRWRKEAIETILEVPVDAWTDPIARKLLRIFKAFGNREIEANEIVAQGDKDITYAALYQLVDIGCVNHNDLLAATKMVIDQYFRRRIVRSVDPVESAKDAISKINGRAQKLQAMCLEDVQEERVKWLWRDRIPMGHLTILDGDPGLGKTTMTIDILSRVTDSAIMPDDTVGERGGALIVSAEDGVADTIKPRFDAARANMREAFVIDYPIKLPRDYDEIRSIIEKHGIVVVVLDPLIAFLNARSDTHKDADVRHALLPIRELARDTGVAIIGIRHLNKSGGSTPMYRGGGSIAFTGAARSVMMAGKHPKAGEGSDLRVLAGVKSNLCKLPSSLEYSMVSLGHVPVIEWHGESDVDAYALCGPPKGEDKDSNRMASAIDFLANELSDGAVLVNDIKRTAKNIGVTWRTLRRAKDELGVISNKSATMGGWTWALPEGVCERDEIPF